MLQFITLFIWNKKYLFLFILLFSLVLSQRLVKHNGLLTTIASDGTGYYAYLPAAIIYHDFDYSFFENSKNRINSIYNPGFGKQKGQTAANKYYCGVSLCLLPFFILGVIISFFAGTDINGYTDTFLMLVTIAPIIYFLLSVFYLSKIAAFFKIPKKSMILFCLLFFFSTHIYHYVLQEPSMSHIYSFFAVSLFFYGFIKLLQQPNNKHFILVGMFYGLALLIRPTNSIVILFIPFFFQNFKEFLLFSQSIFTTHLKKFSLGFLFFSTTIFTQFLFYYLQTGHFFIDSYQNESFDFKHPQIINIFYSYKGGLFLYTPLILIVLLFVILSKHHWYKKTIFIICFSVFVYVISSWWCWWYGGSFSNRAFIDIFPIVIIMSLFLYHQSKYKYKKWILMIAIPCIFCNQIMAYQYRNGFMGIADITEEKYWDIFLNTDMHNINEKIKNKIISKGYIINTNKLDFENTQLVENINKKGGYKSKLSCMVGRNNPYSYSMTQTFDNIDSSKTIYVYAECMIKKDDYVDNNIGLAIEIDENGQFRNWLFASANQFKTQDDGWIKVSSILKLEKHSLTKKHSIKVYATGNIYENYVDDLKYMVIVPFQ